MCCDNPIDLGCAGSCDNIATNIVGECATSYMMSYEFNGAIINKVIPYNGIGFVTIPASTFNESSSATFKIYDVAG